LLLFKKTNIFIINSVLIRCVFAFIMSFSIWAQAQNSAKIHIKVMSYNIKNAYGGSTLKQITEVINDEDLDYVALQEVDSLTSRVSCLNEPHELGNLTNKYWNFAKGINFGDGSYGNSMLSKLLILKTVKVPLLGAEARSALLTYIDLSNGANPDNATVTFISTHWMNGDSQSQLESAIIINAYIDSIIKAYIVSENWPFILLGYLNARNGSNPINEIKDHWKTFNFSYGIDWLFFRPANRWNWISSKKLPDPNKNLKDVQQKFVDLHFGMFIHFNIPTYMDEDWADPDASPEIFNPQKLDCNQWAEAAKSANMSYGCLTTKHHSGFCIWDTKTTDYDVMSSPVKRDVVKEYVEAFRKHGLRVMLYYSILDMHHKLRPGHINKQHIEFIKEQLNELLSNYGPVDALFIDGWDAPWSRISYEAIPFEEIYLLVKSLQPNCLLMELNAAKYPADALFYTDIKSYEQGAGQHISKKTNIFPAMSCLPLQKKWFWKSYFPTTPVKSPAKMVNQNLIPLNKAYCNFILNVAPNRDGLMDDNALAALKEIGKMWKNDGQIAVLSEETGAPIISPNIAKFKPTNSSWSNNWEIMDLANDDNFYSAWKSNLAVSKPWLEIDLEEYQPFNMITIVEKKAYINKYRLQYYENGK